MKIIPFSIRLIILVLFYQTGFSAAINTFDTSIKNWPQVYAIKLIQENAGIVLSWKSMNEPKEVYYEIEKSTDGINFQTACIVLSGFNQGADFSYQFKFKFSGKIYLRIKQINNDGSYRIVGEQSL